MKVTMYGTEICPDCVEAKEELMKHDEIELDYRCITAATSMLKEFLSYRDKEDLFTPIKEGGKIGIPFFILEDGMKTLDVNDIIELNSHPSEQAVNACSLDGHGNC